MSKKWKKIAILKSERVFASSIVLNNGRIWILGGLGVDSILSTTEVLEEDANGKWTVHKGPNLPKPLFGHCVESITNGKVILVGGFDANGISVGQTTSSYEFSWHNPQAFTGEWKTKPWSPLKMERYDHICYSIDGTVQVMGGWHENIPFKLKSEQYNETVMRWEDSDLEINDIHILRSGKIGFSEGKLALIGGVSCQVVNGKNCTKPAEIYELEINPNSLQEWKKSNNSIGLPRSSHVVVVVPTSIDFQCRVF